MELVKYRKRQRTGVPTSGLFLVVGRVKTGKSTFASSFPGSYVLLAERAAEEELEGRIHGINDLEELETAFSLAKKDPEIKTIVIDTIDAIAGWVADKVAKDLGLEGINGKKKGVDGYAKWDTYNRKMKNIVNRFLKCGKLVILCAHYKEAKMDADNRVIIPARLELPGAKSSEFICYHSKLIGHTYKEKGQDAMCYYLTFEGGPLGQWGSWIREVANKTVILPEENPYLGFASIFKKQNGRKKSSTEEN